MDTFSKLPFLLVFLTLSSSLLSCSSTMKHGSNRDDLPILSQDELLRPYSKLGRIQVTREIFGSDFSWSPDIKTWGLNAVRQEAEKMGADAVIFPEVSGGTTNSGLIPSTEYRATGIAIKFK